MQPTPTMMEGSFRVLAEVVRPTTIIRPPRLARRLGVDLLLASETFQQTGSFKFRAAYNVATHITQNRVITASSGNFGQAMAFACQLTGKQCTVVMPDSSAAVKIEAVREFGGVVDLIDLTTKSRSARVAELAAQDSGAYVASPYDDPLVIQGNASLGIELGSMAGDCDYILAPVGGGGLTAGLLVGLEKAGASMNVIGVEPALANDAARSLREGRLISNATEPQTVADGVRTISLGNHNWAILQRGLAGVVEVSEESIQESVRLLFLLANLKAEPTGALGVAALLTRPEMFSGKSVCCVISGGNVDPILFRRLLENC